MAEWCWMGDGRPSADAEVLEPPTRESGRALRRGRSIRSGLVMGNSEGGVGDGDW